LTSEQRRDLLEIVEDRCEKGIAADDQPGGTNSSAIQPSAMPFRTASFTAPTLLN
jgi:hypothetical protein